MNQPTLTAEIARGIVAAIRAGGFPHVAAAAYGVDAAAWERWLRRGRRKHAREPYRSFVRRVEEAQAQARLRAEMAVLESDVRSWLKHGPGRDLPGKPGWAALVRPAPPPNVVTDLLASPEVLRFLALLRTVLAPYPEALAALNTAIDGAARRRHADENPMKDVDWRRTTATYEMERGRRREENGIHAPGRQARG